SFVKDVKKELLSTFFIRKSNDLYDFYQSSDLSDIQTPYLKELRETIFSETMINMISKITGCTLNDYIMLAGQRYPENGYLLCHDDKLEGRRVAFILYLVDENWKEEDGGELALFDSIDNLPNKIVDKVVPKFNSFAFFEVTPTSYHQVCEVLSKMERVSITGWFHGPPREFDCEKKWEIAKEIVNPFSLAKWINPVYLKNSSLSQISEKFIDESSVMLNDFIKPDVLLKFLGSQFEMKLKGPANACSYYAATEVVPLYAFLQSHEFISFIEKICNMSLKVLQAELQKFGHRNYTLVNDNFLDPEGLDVLYFAMNNDWSEEWGGLVHYISGKDTLLSIPPTCNTLTLVMRDSEVIKFVKYVNSQ
ncbi:hypothetical protein ROZALSC1DRAFT_7711, partial [Rozella allomycis CSF55]